MRDGIILWVPSAASPKCPPDIKPTTKLPAITDDVVSHSVLTVSLISVSVVLFQLPAQMEAVGNLDSKSLTLNIMANGQQSLWVFKPTLHVLVCYHMGHLLLDLVSKGICCCFFVVVSCIIAVSSVIWTFKEKTSGPKWCEKTSQSSHHRARRFCWSFTSLYCS